MNFFDNHKRIFFLILSLICLALAGWSTHRFAPSFFEKTVGTVLTPIAGGINKAGSFVSARFKAITNTNSIIDENESLKEEIEKLKLDNSRLALLEQDNADLMGLLNIQGKYSAFDTEGARIIAKDPGNWYDVFIIDKGTNNGLTENMAVVSGGGLVGRIKECGFNYSKVVSIIDGADAVSATAMRTGDVGYVKGDYYNNGMCRMELIDMSSKMAEGDEIITSGFSSVYPEGIVIGRVTEIENADKTSTKTALIAPAADFKHLSSVLVVKNTPKNAEYNFDETTETTTEAEG